MNLRVIGFIIALCLSFGGSYLTAQEGVDKVYHAVDSLKEVLRSKPNDVATLRKLGLLALNMADHDLAKECGSRLMHISEVNNNAKNAATYANTILGQAAILKSEPANAYKYLTEARRLAEIESDSASLASIFNGLAIYSYSYIGDIPEAIHYYHKGLSAAKASGNNRLYYTILNNIANAHLELGDTLGLKYARQSYEQSKQNNNHWQRYTSALCLADTYLFLKDYTRSLRYMADAESVLPYLKDYSPSVLYDMRARAYSAVGSFEKASQNFQKAKDLSRQTPERYLNYLNNEAESQITQGLLKSANTLLDSVLAVSSDTTNTHARIRALDLKSVVSENLGDLRAALNYQKAYNELKSSTTNANTARMMSEAHVKWGLDDLSNQLSLQKVVTIRHQRNFHIALVGIIVLVLCVGILYYFHTKLKRLHVGLVTQMKIALQREQTMKLQIEELKNRKTTLTLTLLKSQQMSNQANLLLTTSSNCLPMKEHIPILTSQETLSLKPSEPIHHT